MTTATQNRPADFRRATTAEIVEWVQAAHPEWREPAYVDATLADALQELRSRGTKEALAFLADPVLCECGEPIKDTDKTCICCGKAVAS